VESSAKNDSLRRRCHADLIIVVALLVAPAPAFTQKVNVDSLAAA
jgi:hypothetical protein